MEIAEDLISCCGALDFSDGLTQFVEEYWVGARGATVEENWVRQDGDNYKSWYVAWFRLSPDKCCKIEVDIVGGSFLVNGSPCSRLPRIISAHRLYRRLFDNATFVVQPLADGGYGTVNPIRGFFYKFYPAGYSSLPGYDSNPIIIQERPDAEEYAVLLSDEIIRGDVPEFLVTEYSHWFVLKSS
jgi:hypothetical protein